MPVDNYSYPVKLQGLTEREAITDALYRCVMAFDGNNKQLFESAITTKRDAFSMQIGDYPKMVGLETVYKDSFDHIGPMETQHHVTCVRIDIKPDGKTAFVTANALNQHFKPGTSFNPEAENFLAGGVYELDFVREGDEWRIKHFGMKIVWTRGNQAVLAHD